uniref:HMG box domain-containing protein n=1 Tax=Arion vulgaris TaxID=1028688 RepID=A0A0B7A0L6_9EUPU
MPPKQKPNGYFMFMQAERQRIHSETKQMPSMQEIARICTESWKKLSAQDKSRYNAMAKQSKGKVVDDDDDRDRQRLNNQGQNIAERKTAVKEVANRRTRENQLLVKSWNGKDILDVPFHLIDFQVMYTDEPVDFFLPLEVGLVCFTLRDGIIKHMHHFIDPGDAPLGCMNLALRHSDNTHKIPLHFEQAETNFLQLWTQITDFMVTDPDSDDVPPIFCLSNDRKIVESCLEFLHYYTRSREPNVLTKVYVLEELVLSLLMQSGKVSMKPSETQIQDSLLRNQWDYISSIRCSFHDEVDCSYCSLSIVRRLCFALFDILSNILDFKLKTQHMPDETSNSAFTLVRPTTWGKHTATDSVRNVRHTQPDDDGSRSPSPPRFAAPYHPASSNHTARRAWGTPTINRNEVKLSDSNEEEEDDDEIRSRSDEYQLAELRKPKSAGLSHHIYYCY